MDMNVMRYIKLSKNETFCVNYSVTLNIYTHTDICRDGFRVCPHLSKL